MAMHDAERDLIGAAIIAPELTQQIKLTAGQFDSPQAGAIWQAIGTIHGAGRQPDPILIVDEASRLGVLVDHGTIVELVGCGMAVNADVYADKIRDAATRRDLAQVLSRAQHKLAAGEPVEEVIGDVSLGLGAESPTEREVSKAMTLDEFVGQRLPDTEWAIPGLLAKGDRLVLTGTEGGGKTMMMRQLGICAAGGRHPLTLDAMEPRRVLYVDCENPMAIMVKTMTKMHHTLRQQGVDFGDRMWVRRFPQGLDLAKATDRLMLHAMCRTFRPDILLIGPAYKLYVGGSGSREEDLARQVTSVLDGLREEFGFCLVLEHHSPHGQAGFERSVRPIGSSLWLRWPEFGYGLRPASDSGDVRKVDFIPWRGSRDQRDWPRQLVQGTSVPWVDARMPGY